MLYMALIVYIFSFISYRLANSVTWNGITFTSIANGKGSFPFQYRGLFQFSLRVVAMVFSNHQMLADDTRLWSAVYDALWLVAVSGAFIQLGSALEAGRIVQRGTIVLGLAAVFANYAYMYFYNFWIAADLPAVTFATLGLAFILRGEITELTILVFLAGLNRETSCFILLYAWAAWRTDVGSKEAAKICIPLAISWLAAHCVVLMVFGVHTTASFMANNDESRFVQNIHFILDLPNQPVLQHYLLPAFSYQYLSFPFFFFIRDKRVQGFYLVTILIFLAMLFPANIYEVRIFTEVIPVWTIGTVLLFRQTAGVMWSIVLKTMTYPTKSLKR